MAKAIAELEARTKKILEERNAELADIESLISEARQQRAAAENDMMVATNNGDTGAYRTAKQNRSNADDAIEMYSARIETLNKKPLITEEEYREGASKAMEYLKSLSAATRRKLIEHVEEMKTIAENATKELEDGNRILHEWQHTLYRDDCIRKTNNGSQYYDRSLEQKYEDWEIIQFINSITGSSWYEALKA